MDVMDESHKAVMTTLQLLESGGAEGSSIPTDQISETTCLLCDEVFQLADLNPILKHLVEEHRFVVAGVRMIADFKKYAEYWKKRLQELPISHYCSVIVTNTGSSDSAPQEKFHLLCDILPEDKQLRQRLQREKLEEVLMQQAREREQNSEERACLFCKEQFTGNRSTLLNHMAADHSFSVGKPDNIVYVDEFLSVLREKLNKLQCLYCENTFKDRMTLKEHMRKKNHKRIKASNHSYDKYYVVNYLEFGKQWAESRTEDQEEEEEPMDELTDQSEPDDDWNDWRETAELRIVCLFCTETASSSRDLLSHMTKEHQFDLEAVRGRHQLNFYQQVKLINFIRRQVYQKLCIYCDLRCDTREELLHHMTSTGHISQTPDVNMWDQPQYFFPTYEDDALLYVLETAEEVDDGGTDGTVFAEDTPVMDQLLRDLHDVHNSVDQT